MTVGLLARLGRVAVLCLTALADVRAADGVALTVQRGAAAGEVRLDWTGGQPAFQVYRSPDKAHVVQAANKLGVTAGFSWTDVPPPGTTVFYRIVGPCLIPSPEACDGVDDDCDGIVDNGCPIACATDADCASSQFCDINGLCATDRADGQACVRPGQCATDWCTQGVCCASGDCCTNASQCTAYAQSPTCDSPSTCQGTRVDAACESYRCTGQTVDDDSGCAGQIGSTCGPYPSIACTSAPSQNPNQASLCASSCAGDANCDASAHCEGNVCLDDFGPGASCTAAHECSSGSCADEVCCDSACAGVCRACDLPGTAGACTPVPGGQDPDAECGGLSCLGYYYGWSGSSCQRKADVPSGVASCDGAGACRSAAQECGAYDVAGATASTCDATCQTPTAGTCVGTTPGSCTNISAGNTTCGTGACQQTVAACVNGAPNTCTPGTPTTETCNGIDDNCDGTIDNGAFADAYEPNESCASPRALAGVGSDQSQTYSAMTVYASGDVDSYSILATETDSSCSCGVFSFDEDYQLNVWLTAPSGTGSYELCVNTNTCSFPAGYCFTVAAGQTFQVSQWLDGACTTTDSYVVYVRVRGLSGSDFACQPYTLRYQFLSGFCR